MKKRNALQSNEKPTIDLGVLEMRSCVPMSDMNDNDYSTDIRNI